MIHASKYSPRIFPHFVDQDNVEMDRVQDLTSTATLNKTKIEEVGRVGVVGYRQATPDISVTMRQFEYGNLELYRMLANLGSSVNTVNLSDFTTSSFDIAGYKTDDNGTFLGTIWYPNLRVSGLSLNIGDPESDIERNFTFAAEDEIALINDNKYLIHKRYVISGSGNDRTVSLGSDPTPIADPDNSGQFLFKVIKHSGGTSTKLDYGTGWSYDGAGTLTINGASTAGDVVWVWFSAGSYIAGADTFVENDVDLASINADSVSIILVTNNILTRLQSVGIDVTFDRQDIREIGNKDVVARGIKDTTATITLGKIIESYTIEEVLRGKAGASYGKIDARKFVDTSALIVKIYEDNTKTNFKLGYKFLDLAVASRDTGTPVSDYVTAGISLTGEEGLVTSVEGIL